MTVDCQRPTGERLGALADVPNVLLAVSLVLLSDLVAHHGWPIRLDRAVYRWLPSPASGGLTHVVSDLTQTVATMANPATTVAFVVAVALLVSARQRRTAALRRVTPALLALGVTVVAAKALLHRLGPPGTSSHPYLGAFPSGHTATALVCVGTLAALLSERRPGWRVPLRFATAAWTTLVAASMVFHRYHWATDVLASGLLGLLILRIDKQLTSATRSTSTVTGRTGPADHADQPTAGRFGVAGRQPSERE